MPSKSIIDKEILVRIALLLIVIEVKFMQFSKACSAILVTLEGIVMEVSPKQSAKAKLPMLFTLLGIVVLLQPNIRVSEEVSMIALQLFLESYLGLFESTSINFSSLQFPKAPLAMFVTLSGMVMEVSPVQP